MRRNIVNPESNVTTDATLAKESGVSYGKYKAGIRNDTAESEYQVMPTQFVVRKSEDTLSGKAKAFIK